MERQQKERAEKLVSIYLDWAMSSSNDAGWTGESTLGRLVDFKGELPPPSGNDQADLKMINSIWMLRGEHAELTHARRIIFSIDKKYRDAVISSVLCRNRWDKGVKCDDAYITLLLQISSVSAYRKRVQRALEKIIELDSKTARYCA